MKMSSVTVDSQQNRLSIVEVVSNVQANSDNSNDHRVNAESENLVYVLMFVAFENTHLKINTQHER